jgi:hypothetical protein
MTDIKPVKIADRGEIEEWAHDLPVKFLLCRELGHNWRPNTAVQVERTFERSLRCPRCKTERWQILSLRGEVLAQSYRYPENYLAPKMGRLVRDCRDALRLESISRIVPIDGTDDEQARV